MDTSQKTIGAFRIVGTLGAGAAGEAFKAEHVETGEQVAIKLMHQRLTGDPDYQNRFVREVTVLQKLEHPNIVRQIDSGLDNDRLYMVMEWVAFGTLEEVLKRRVRLPWREAAECTLQICQGLDHAHQRGVIHRDLKPANLFLSSDGHVKIGDFGLARDVEAHRLTSEGNTVGTCRYMAPEQVRGEDELTGAVDLYAVGCLLFRMLDGRMPFDGETIIQIFEHHLYSDIPKLSPDSERPAEVDEIVARLLIKDPAERPGKAGEVAEALQAILDGNAMRSDFTSVVHSDATETNGELRDSISPNLTERLVTDGSMAEGKSVAWGWIATVIGLVAMIGLIVALAGRN